MSQINYSESLFVILVFYWYSITRDFKFLGESTGGKQLWL